MVRAASVRMTLPYYWLAVKLSSEVEADKNFHQRVKATPICTRASKARRITGTGTKDKTAVMGILER